MPIKGLTDRGGQFPQIGQLRKGGKKTSDTAPGPDLKHFRFTTEDPDAAKSFLDTYGKEPTTIRVILPFRTTEENFEAWREEYVASGLKHRCDGQYTVLILTPAGEYSQIPKRCPGGCKPTGRLKVVIPAFNRLAYVTVLTTSVNDIIELTQNLQAIEAIRGDLRYIPLMLTRVPRKISTPVKDGKRAHREKWLLHIEAEPQWVVLQLAAGQEAALPKATIQQLALPAGPDDDGDDDDEDMPDITDMVEEIEGEVDEPQQPTKQAEKATNGKHADDGATRFWLAVKAAGIRKADMKDAQKLADRAAKNEITWESAIASLPQNQEAE